MKVVCVLDQLVDLVIRMLLVGCVAFVKADQETVSDLCFAILKPATEEIGGEDDDMDQDEGEDGSCAIAGWGHGRRDRKPANRLQYSEG